VPGRPPVANRTLALSDPPQSEENIMFVIAGTVAVTAAVIARLVAVVRADRPITPPRSHHHERDQYSMRIV
jgi:hypothetical protein